MSVIIISSILPQVPNPLFDLAGITCGHCLVPFWTFFGATLIGKAVIKMHLQVVGALLTLLLTNQNLMWFSMVCTLIDNDTRHHSGQNVADSRGAGE